jgi:predicted RND superfamily exporter protein
MGTARDIALIFLSIEALVMALVPLLILVGLAYGVYYLRGLTKQYLQVAQHYAQQLHDYVEKASKAITDPFIRVHSTTQMVLTIMNNLFSRRLS